MKKKILFLLFIEIASYSFSQKELVRVNYNYNIDVWSPYSETGTVYQDINGTISSNVWNLNIQTQIIDKPRWGMNIGFAYKRINYKVIDHLNFWNYKTPITGPNSGGTPKHRVFIDPADLLSVSNSIGLTFEGYYSIFSTEKMTSNIGLNTEIYFLEFYKTWYESDDFTETDPEGSIPIENNPIPRNLFLSSINSSIFFRNTWYLANHFSLGAKLSLGANIYSDWEQFKRYAWLGVGVEIGFLGKEK